VCSFLRLKPHFTDIIQEGELGVSTIGVVEHLCIAGAPGGPEDI